MKKYSVTDIISFYFPFRSIPNKEDLEWGVVSERALIHSNYFRFQVDNFEYNPYFSMNYNYNGKNVIIVGKPDIVINDEKVLIEIKKWNPIIFSEKGKRYLNRIKLQLSLYKYLLAENNVKIEDCLLFMVRLNKEFVPRVMEIIRMIEQLQQEKQFADMVDEIRYYDDKILFLRYQLDEYIYVRKKEIKPFSFEETKKFIDEFLRIQSLFSL